MLQSVKQLSARGDKPVALGAAAQGTNFAQVGAGKKSGLLAATKNDSPGQRIVLQAVEELLQVGEDVGRQYVNRPPGYVEGGGNHPPRIAIHAEVAQVA